MSRHERHTKSPGAALSAPFTLDMSDHPVLAAIADANSKFFTGMVELNQEWAGFVNQRLQKDFSLLPRLGACKNAEDAFNVYSEFYRQAFEDYQSEFAKLTKMGQSLAAKTTEAMPPSRKGPQ